MGIEVTEWPALVKASAERRSARDMAGEGVTTPSESMGPILKGVDLFSSAYDGVEDKDDVAVV